MILVIFGSMLASHQHCLIAGISGEITSADTPQFCCTAQDSDTSPMGEKARMECCERLLAPVQQGLKIDSTPAFSVLAVLLESPENAGLLAASRQEDSSSMLALHESIPRLLPYLVLTGNSVRSLAPPILIQA